MSDVAEWTEFRRRCLKPDSERIGTWTARKFARPVALRITWLVAPLGVTAHQATLLAALTALAALVGFAHGSPIGWLWGAVLLEVWYVLDHVDGQLARRCGTASLDGTTFDYLMHHSVNLLLPAALAYGVARQTGDIAWCLVGATWSWGMLVIGLRHDARYKTFIQRLKHVHGTLQVVGGGGGRPVPADWPHLRLRSVAAWCALKLYEAHTLTHLLLVVSAMRLLLPSLEQILMVATAAVPALPAVPLAVYLVARDLRRGEAESQFAAWFRVPDGSSLEFRNGHWYVETVEAKNPPSAVSSSRSPDVLTQSTLRS